MTHTTPSGSPVLDGPGPDPRTMAMARVKVRHHLDRLADLEHQADDRGDTGKARGLAIARLAAQRYFLGDGGCLIGAFDDRRTSTGVPTAEDEDATTVALRLLEAQVRALQARKDARVRAAALREAAAVITMRPCGCQTCDMAHRAPAAFLRARADEIDPPDHTPAGHEQPLSERTVEAVDND